jgi:hypothetical protein
MLYVLVLGMLIGISRPNLDLTRGYFNRDCADSWFMHTTFGTLFGNGKFRDDEAGGYEQRAIVLACSWTLAAAPFDSSAMARSTAQVTQRAA